MKRILWATIAAAPLLLSTTATAGDYHKNGTLYCAQCHVMHFSQGHGYNPNGSGFYLALNQVGGPAGPHEFLLRGAVNDLCLACHDNNGFAPDVYGSANTGNGPTDVRSAGYLNKVGDANEASGHTLGSSAYAPGSTLSGGWNHAAGTGGLNCVDCHHQHGAGVSGAAAGTPNYSLYRNLSRKVGLSATNTPVTYNYTSHGTNDLTRDVFERQSAEYSETVIDWNEPAATPDNNGSAIAHWCAGCHDNFHGAIGGPQVGGVAFGAGFEEFVRHPSAGVDIGKLGGGHSSVSQFWAHTNKVKVMSPTGVWSGGTAPTDLTPTCISCHKAHGNGNAFGLIFRNGAATAGAITENGDVAGNALEDLCGQCHVQGAYAFANP